jgi:hypothetical protein
VSERESHSGQASLSVLTQYETLPCLRPKKNGTYFLAEPNSASNLQSLLISFDFQMAAKESQIVDQKSYKIIVF